MPVTLKRGNAGRSPTLIRNWFLVVILLVAVGLASYGKLGRKRADWLVPKRPRDELSASALAAVTALLERHHLATSLELSKMILNVSQSDPPYLYITFRDEWDGLVSPSMRANGGLFDAHIHRLFDRIIQVPGKRARRRQGSELVIDAGMNFGSFALYAANRGCRVIGFEMQPSVAAAVLFASHLNGFTRRLQVIPHPVWNQSGHPMVFYPRRDNVGGTHALDTPRSPQDSTDPAVRLRTVRIADWVPRRSLIRFMKLDVEGSELEALRGMMDLLKRKRVLNLVMELQPEPSYREAVELLYSCGYRCIELQLVHIEQIDHMDLALELFKEEPKTTAAYWDSFNFHGTDLWCIPWLAPPRSRRHP